MPVTRWRTQEAYNSSVNTKERKKNKAISGYTQQTHTHGRTQRAAVGGAMSTDFTFNLRKTKYIYMYVYATVEATEPFPFATYLSRRRRVVKGKFGERAPTKHLRRRKHATPIYVPGSEQQHRRTRTHRMIRVCMTQNLAAEQKYQHVTGRLWRIKG